MALLSILKSRRAKKYCLLMALFATFVLYFESALHPGMIRGLENEGIVDVADEGVERPIIHTFYEPNGGCCGMTEEGHNKLVEDWEIAWQSRGWDTKVLKKEDALKHPEFDAFDKKLSDLNVDNYNKRCFWRWMAMVMVETADGQGGGWMSDYDTFPLGLSAEEGLEIAKEPGFKSFSLHVPNIIHATSAGWDKVLHAMFDVMPEDRGPGNRLITDMFMLLDTRKQFNDDDLEITAWERKSAAFPYKRAANNTVPLEISCDIATSAKVAHLSHSDCDIAFNKLHVYPRLEGVTKDNYLERRGEAAMVVMKDFREQCLDEPELKPEVTSTSR